MTRDDGVFGGILARTEGAFGLVETEAGFAAPLVRSVAFETAIAQNRSDIAIVLDRGLSAPDAHPGNQGEVDDKEL